MNTLVKLFKFLYGDSLRYIGFLIALTLFVWFVYIFMAWPWETIGFIVGAIVFYAFFCFFTEIGR